MGVEAPGGRRTREGQAGKGCSLCASVCERGCVSVHASVCVRGVCQSVCVREGVCEWGCVSECV